MGSITWKQFEEEVKQQLEERGITMNKDTEQAATCENTGKYHAGMDGTSMEGPFPPDVEPLLVELRREEREAFRRLVVIRERIALVENDPRFEAKLRKFNQS